MNNLTIILPALILVLNVGLFMQVRKQGEANHQMAQAMQAMTTAAPGGGGVDQALVAEINKIVREELAKTPGSSAGDPAKLQQLETRVEAVQKMIFEKLTNQDVQKNESHLRAEATKLREEVLAICGRR